MQVRRKQQYIPTGKSYFSGGGLLDRAVTEAGINLIQSLECDPTSAKTLRMNFDHPVIEEDIRKIEVLKQPRADIHFMTYPCTKYSAIADIHGTRTGDELFLHAFRHIAIEQPEAYVVENVPGMKKFPVVMEAMTKIPGYYMNVFCPVDASIWLPQHRKRLILIGTKRLFNINPPTSTKRIRLKDIIEKDADVNVPDCVYSRLDGKYRDLPIISDPEDDNALAPTCVAHYGKDQGTRLVRDKRYPRGVRPYTLREWARLQGMPDDHKFAGGQTAVFKQIGNGVAFHKGLWIGKELMRYFN